MHDNRCSCSLCVMPTDGCALESGVNKKTAHKTGSLALSESVWINTNIQNHLLGVM